MPSDRFEEFLKNASPEVKAQIAATGEKAARTTPDTLQPATGDLRPIDRRAEQSRPEAAPPEPYHGPSNQQPQGRTAQAMDQKAQAQAAEQGKEATKSGASIEELKAPTPPAKEPER